MFMQKILDDKPTDVLEYAGAFFDSAKLADVTEEFMRKEKEAAAKNRHLSDLIKGKTLI